MADAPVMKNEETDLAAGVREMVRQALTGEGTGHDWHHIVRVCHNARKIAHAEGADMLVVELAALLHDLDDWKVTGQDPGAAPVRAQKCLEGLGAGPDLIAQVSEIVRTIDYKGSLDEDRTLSLEAQVVHDADKLDAIGAIGIARCFTFNGHIGRPIFDPEIFPDDEVTQAKYTDLSRRENTGINHFFDKLLRLKDRMYTQSGAALARERHDFMITYLYRFFDELGADDWRDHLKTFLARKN